jgi:hypothetical protein
MLQAANAKSVYAVVGDELQPLYLLRAKLHSGALVDIAYMQMVKRKGSKAPPTVAAMMTSAYAMSWLDLATATGEEMTSATVPTKYTSCVPTPSDEVLTLRGSVLAGPFQLDVDDTIPADVRDAIATMLDDM